MAPLHRLLVGLCLVLLLGGVAGVVADRSGRAGAEARSPGRTAGTARAEPTTAPVAPSTPASVAPSTSRPAGPGSAALAAGLITPTDMGGYYRIVPSYATSMLSSAPCLAALGATASQSGRALTALLGPDEHSVPTIVEEVSSYPGETSRSHYERAVGGIGACTDFSFEFGGPRVSAHLRPSAIPSVGDAERVWSGSFTAGGASFDMEIGVVLDGQEVLSLVWIDSVPPSDPVMGSFASTVSLAIGKLA